MNSTGGSYGGTMPDVAVERQSEVAEQIGRIQSVSEYIDKLTEELESALSKSILAQRKESNQSDAKTSQPEPVRVPMAEALNARANHLEMIRERLSSILSRLEA